MAYQMQTPTITSNSVISFIKSGFSELRWPLFCVFTYLFKQNQASPEKESRLGIRVPVMDFLKMLVTELKSWLVYVATKSEVVVLKGRSLKNFT